MLAPHDLTKRQDSDQICKKTGSESCLKKKRIESLLVAKITFDKKISGGIGF